MNSNLTDETIWGLNVLYKATMELYESYFTALEAALEKTPDSNTERLKELNALVQEANQALQDDLAVFEKAITADSESLMKMQDELKIQSIYNKLKT